jgi:hypothetical protein
MATFLNLVGLLALGAAGLKGFLIARAVQMLADRDTVLGRTAGGMLTLDQGLDVVLLLAVAVVCFGCAVVLNRLDDVGEMLAEGIAGRGEGSDPLGVPRSGPDPAAATAPARMPAAPRPSPGRHHREPTL